MRVSHLMIRLAAIGVMLAAGFACPLFARAEKGKKPAAVKATGVWKSLVKAGAKWTLQTSPDGGQPAQQIQIETYDVRKVGEAEVARLRFSVIADKGRKGELMSLGQVPSQVAVTDKGVWFLARENDDAQVLAALKGSPTQPDPPVAMQSMKRKDGKMVDLRKLDKGSLVCVGFGPKKGAPPCNDVCFGDFCVSAESGIVIVEGAYAPNNDVFMQSGW